MTIPQKLRQWADRLGSQRALANELGVSEAYLSDVINGRREPGPMILKALGLERVVSYERPRRPMKNIVGSSDKLFGYKVLTHDYRSPLEGGPAIWDGITLPFTLPTVRLDTSDAECAAGWNYCADAAIALRIAGFWPTGRPSVVLVVEPSSDAISRGDKCRASSVTITRRVTELEVEDAIGQFSTVFCEHAEFMTREQLAWRQALGRPGRERAGVVAGLSEALKSRGLGDWRLNEFPTAWDAWAAWAARDAWAARAARDAWAAWAAWAAWDAWDARAAWAAWDARAARAVWDALTLAYARVNPKIIKGNKDPMLLTTGLRDAYANGLEIAVPTGPNELGWSMAA